MALQTLTKPKYTHRPQFTPDDFLISKKGNESRYVPASLVPENIVGDIFPNRVIFYFAYSVPETSSVSKTFDNTEIATGKYTGKILSITLSFQPDFASLMAAFENARTAIRKAKAFTQKNSIQKSYEIIANFLNQAQREFSTEMRVDIERMFTENKSQS